MPIVLFLLFVIVPALEIAAFIQIGSLIGVLPTLAGIVVTAVTGAWVVRYQGLKVLDEARAALDKQVMPVEPVVHGIFILIAGVLLMTPGYVTDTIGGLLLVPPLRLAIGRRLWNWLRTRADVTIVASEAGPAGPYRHDRGATTIDGQAVEIVDDDALAGHPDKASPWRDDPSRSR